MPQTQTSHVVVFGLGGTIAMSSAATGGVVPALSAEALVAAVPGLAETGISLKVIDFRRLPGASLSFEDLDELVAEINAERKAGAVGFVAMKGTDPIEESSYHIDVSYAGAEPIIVVGAMRNAVMAGADGPANLLAAVITAAHRASRNRGVLVVLNDEIHAASRVRKTHSTSTGTFRSPNGGPLGYLVEGTPRYVNLAPARLFAPAPQPGARPRIGLHTVSFGEDGVMLEGISSRIDGLVVAGMGVGHVPQRIVGHLTSLAERVPVVFATRTGAGPVLTSTYGFPGSERDLISRGLIPAGFLDPLKSRVLLRALIAADAELPQIKQAFAVAGGMADSADWPWPLTESR